MKCLIIRITLMFSILLPAAIAAAQGPVAPESVAVTRLMRLSGREDQIRQFPSVLKSIVADPAQEDVPPALKSAITAAVDRHIVPDDISASVALELSRALSDSDVVALLAWYESVPGQRITVLQDEAVADEDEYRTVIAELSADDRLVEKMRRIDELIEFTEYALEIQEHTQIAMAEAVSAAYGPEAGVDLEQIRQQWESSREPLTEGLRRDSSRNMLYTFRDLSAADMAAYLDFLESDPARKFHRAVRVGMVQSLKPGITAFAKEFTAILAAQEDAAP